MQLALQRAGRIAPYTTELLVHFSAGGQLSAAVRVAW